MKTLPKIPWALASCLASVTTFSILVQLLYRPTLWPVPGRDSCGYLYVAQQMLKGGILYRELWDHKGPVIYYLDAVGLALGRGSVWGVWGIEVIALLTAAIAGFAALRRLLGDFPALAGTTVLLLSLPRVLDYPNVTEEFSLPIAMVALYIFARYTCGDRRPFLPLALGVLAGLALLLKQNLVGPPLTFIACLVGTSLLERRLFRGLAEALFFGLGLTCAVVPFLLVLGTEGALPAYWDCTFRYNLYYSNGTTWASRVHAILEGSRITWEWGFLLAALALSLVALIPRFSRTQDNSRWLWLLLWVWCAVELILCSISGRTYPHYFIPLLPPFAMLVALTMKSGAHTANVLGARLQPSGHRILRILLIGACVWLLLPYGPDFERLSLLANVHECATPNPARSPYLQMANAIRAHSSPEETVLVWGAEAGINFFAGRKSPTRFFYQNPLYTPGYQRPDQVDAFLHDLRTGRPKLVLDTSATNSEIPPFDGRMSGWESPSGHYRCLPEMAEVALFFKEWYRPVAMNGRGWVLYERVSAGANSSPASPSP